MAIKKIIKIHLLLTILTGVLAGIFFYVTDTTDSVQLPLVIPGGVLLMFIAYGGPVTLGLLILRVAQKKNPLVSPKSYLTSYYVLVLLLFSLLWLAKDQDGSGFGVFLLPWLPIPAFIFGMLYILLVTSHSKR